MGKVLASGSLTALMDGHETYECQYDWPEDCECQFGTRGVVYTGGRPTDMLEDPLMSVVTVLAPEAMREVNPRPYYTTAFFEAFPRSPNTFIRGEGETVAAAEEAAWRKFQKATGCPGHEFEARGYTNGLGFCKHCNMSQIGVMPPSVSCVGCGQLVYPHFDKDDNPYCDACWDALPDDRIPEYMIEVRDWARRRRAKDAGWEMAGGVVAAEPSTD